MFASSRPISPPSACISPVLHVGDAEATSHGDIQEVVNLEKRQNKQQHKPGEASLGHRKHKPFILHCAICCFGPYAALNQIGTDEHEEANAKPPWVGLAALKLLRCAAAGAHRRINDAAVLQDHVPIGDKVGPVQTGSEQGISYEFGERWRALLVSSVRLDGRRFVRRMLLHLSTAASESTDMPSEHLGWYRGVSRAVLPLADDVSR